MTEITLNLEALHLGEETIAEAIVKEAARQVIEGTTTRHDVAEIVTQITASEIRSRIAPLLDEAMTKAFQPTSAYGEPKGNPKTLREVIVEIATKYLREPDPEYRSSVHGQRKTRIEAFIAKEVKAAVDEQLRVLMLEAQEEITAGVKDRAAEVIAETIRRVSR